MDSNPATMEDVAARAKTSTATVSRVLANSGKVSDALRRRVLAAVEEMDYAPSRAAKAMGRRRGPSVDTRVILLAACGNNYPKLFGTWAEAVGGVLEAAEGIDANVTMARITLEELEGNKSPDAVTAARADGMVVIPAHGREHDVLLGGPAVMLGSVPRAGCSFPASMPDYHLGNGELFNRLVQLGHQRFEFVFQYERIYVHRERAGIFQGMVAQSGKQGTVVGPIGSDLAGYAQAFANRPSAERPTAVFADDSTAMNLLRHFGTVGIRVPEDVSVVGFDGFAWAREAVPELTSWYVDWGGLGGVAVNTLTQLVAGQAAPTRILVGGHLHEGATIAAPST